VERGACTGLRHWKTPLTALAARALFNRAVKRFQEEGGTVSEGLSSVLIGARDIGEVRLTIRKCR